MSRASYGHALNHALVDDALVNHALVNHALVSHALVSHTLKKLEVDAGVMLNFVVVRCCVGCCVRCCVGCQAVGSDDQMSHVACVIFEPGRVAHVIFEPYVTYCSHQTVEYQRGQH